MVRLVPLDAVELRTFLEAEIRSYADDNVRAGRWSQEEALGNSRKQIEQLLPSGIDTPNQYLFSIRSDPEGDKVGVLWMAVEPRGAYIYDLLVFPQFRRRGHAEAAMRSAEEVARSKGATSMRLQVFGFNDGARKLYDKLGYSAAAIMMAKPLEG